MLYETIGANIRRARRGRGMTQGELADYLHVSPQMISRYENGSAVPDVGMLARIGERFGLSLDALCGLDRSSAEERIRYLTETYSEGAGGSFADLGERYDRFVAEADGLMCDDRVMEIQLSLLEALHDAIENDRQHREINERLFECASRILDVSADDRLRSLANYRMALYYWETPHDSAAYGENLRLSKEYLSRVLLCTYFSDYTPVIGADARDGEYRETKIANAEFFIGHLRKILLFMSENALFAEANERYRDLLAVLREMTPTEA